jgi:hypothetical protein
MMMLTRTLLALTIFTTGAVADGAPYRPHAVIRSVAIERPNLEVHGSNLSKVELYGVPSGTGITVGGILGSAKRQNSAGDDEIWIMPIPQKKDGVGSFTEIYAKGFDSRGRVVRTKSLPILGVSNIYDALWGKPPN